MADRHDWHFLTLLDTLAEHNDYAATRIGPVPVVVQNFRGRLGGFRNVCSHRFALIHTEPCGSALLRCRYHGWTFDAEGVPVGIPFNESDFGFDRAARRRLALTPVAVETCGRFVFVRVADTGAPLARQLGDQEAILIAVSRDYPRVAPVPGPADDGETLIRVAPNLRLGVTPGRCVRVVGEPPAGAEDLVARVWRLVPGDVP